MYKLIISNFHVINHRIFVHSCSFVLKYLLKNNKSLDYRIRIGPAQQRTLLKVWYNLLLLLFMHFEPPEDNLSMQRTNHLNLYRVPKKFHWYLFRGSTVFQRSFIPYIHVHTHLYAVQCNCTVSMDYTCHVMVF